MISHRLIAGICLALVPMTVAAIPVTYEFSGSVGFFNADLPPDGSIPEPFVPYGTEFTGSFTYENETLPNYQAPGVLQYQNAITGATISFGAGGSLGEFGFDVRKRCFKFWIPVDNAASSVDHAVIEHFNKSILSARHNRRI